MTESMEDLAARVYGDAGVWTSPAAQGGEAALSQYVQSLPSETTRAMRAGLIGHFKPCVTDIYLHIDARMADYIHTHP